MKIGLIKSRKEDLPIIARIFRTEFSKPPYNEKWTEEKSIEKMEFFRKFYDLYAITYGGETVGFICINPTFMCPGEVAFGEEMAIKSDYQNKGIGTFIFKKIFEIYQKRGFKKFMGIAAKKGGPMSLYKRLGVLPSKKGVLIEKRFER